MRKFGISNIEFTGRKIVSDMRVLGKGCVGIVVLAHRKGEQVALKIRRVDADRSSMAHEAEMLKKANTAGVGPKMIDASRNFLVIQFVEGSPFPDWLKKRKPKTIVKNALRDLLGQCWRLDEIGLDHGELSHAPKHLIIDKTGKPCIVDFESASVNRRVSNVTSLCQFLFMDRAVADIVARRIGEVDKDVLVQALKRYKHHRARESFDEVLRVCSLA